MSKELKLFAGLICLFYDLVDLFFDLIIVKFDPDVTIFFDLGNICSSFVFPVFDVFDGKIEMVGIVDATFGNPLSERLSESFQSYRYFGGNRV